MENLKDMIRESRSRARKTTTVDVPELGVPVILQQLKYGDVRDLLDGDNPARHLGTMLARMIVDENGNRLFSDAESAELDELSSGSFQVLMNAANTLNGFSKAEISKTVKN